MVYSDGYTSPDKEWPDVQSLCKDVWESFVRLTVHPDSRENMVYLKEARKHLDHELDRRLLELEPKVPAGYYHLGRGEKE